jgi:hypothetical protein
MTSDDDEVSGDQPRDHRDVVVAVLRLVEKLVHHHRQGRDRDLVFVAPVLLHHRGEEICTTVSRPILHGERHIDDVFGLQGLHDRTDRDVESTPRVRSRSHRDGSGWITLSL